MVRVESCLDGVSLPVHGGVIYKNYKRHSQMQTPISVILICCFVAFGGFLFGYDIGLIGGIIEMDYFIQDFGQTDSNGSTIQVWKKSFIVSILSAGTFLGAVLAGPLADKVGRRMAIIHTCIIFSLGVVFQIFSNKSWQVMSFGRLIAGIGVGLISDLVPLYQVETSPKHLRGALVSCYQLAISLGILFAFFVNSYTRSFKGSSSYNIPIGLQLFYSLFLGGGIAFLNQGMIFLPDSPRILIKRDRFDEAKEALCRLWGTSLDDPRIIQEMQEMQLAHEADLAVGKVGYSELFSPEIVKRTHLAVLLQMFQQLTGINFIMYYGVTFFKNAGFKDPFKIQMITGFVNVLSTLPGIYLIDRIGRRSLMISGALLMLFGHFIVGFAGNSSTSSGYVLVWAVCLFIAGFAASWGPAVWVFHEYNQGHFI